MALTSGRNGHIMMTMKKARREIPAGEFKTHCLGLLDQVAKNKETLVVTKRGRPIAKVVPLEEKESESLKGSIIYHKDIVEPTGEVWEADQ